MANQRTHVTRRNEDIEAAAIDASGALAVTGNATVGGTLGVTGATTLTGNVAVTGNLSATGTVSGPLPVQELTASGAITITNGVVQLNHVSTPVAATLAAPTAGAHLYIVNTSASGTAAHTVTTAAGVTWDGTNNTATLDAPDEAIEVVAMSATRWYIVVNNGTVAFSSV